MNIHTLRSLQAIIRNVTDRLIRLALDLTHERHPLGVRVLGLVLLTALLWQVVMQSGLGVWMHADDLIRLALKGLGMLGIHFQFPTLLTLASLTILAMMVCGVVAGRKAVMRLEALREE